MTSVNFLVHHIWVLHEIEALVDDRLEFLSFLDFDLEMLNTTVELFVDLSLYLFSFFFFLLGGFDDSTHSRVRLHQTVRLSNHIRNVFEKTSFLSKPQGINLVQESLFASDLSRRLC